MLHVALKTILWPRYFSISCISHFRIQWHNLCCKNKASRSFHNHFKKLLDSFTRSCKTGWNASWKPAFTLEAQWRSHRGSRLNVWLEYIGYPVHFRYFQYVGHNLRGDLQEKFHDNFLCRDMNYGPFHKCMVAANRRLYLFHNCNSVNVSLS